MKLLKNYWLLIAILLFSLVIVRSCEQEPKVVTNTKIVYKTKTDTVTKVIIDEKIKKVYVDRIEKIKGKDSIVYRDAPSDTTVEANQYAANLVTNNATAQLTITTTGQLLDVSGTIKYNEKETTNSIIITKPKSGLFLYGETSATPLFSRAEIGLDYQIKNTLIVGSSFSFDNISKQNYINLKLGFRIF